MRWTLVIGLVLAGLWGCESDSGGSNGDGDADSCDVTLPTACQDDAPTYADVQPIFEERCTVCHTDDTENSQCPMPGQCWSLEDYSHIFDWAPQIRTELAECKMPLPGSGVTMTNTEREEILAWLRCGAPE